jgi:hypothetical protein
VTATERPKSAKLRSLLSDAEKAGYTVKKNAGGWVIHRPTKVNQHASEQNGLQLFEDGTAVRLGVDLGAAAGLRSHNDMRQVLGLQPEGAR